MTTERVPAARSQGRPRVAIVLPLAVGAVLLGATVAQSDPAGLLLVLAYGVPGVILAIRRPGHRIAWLLLLMAAGLFLGNVRVTASVSELTLGGADSLGAFSAWANATGWVFVFAGFTGLSLTFPSGHLPRDAWRMPSIVLACAFVPLAAVLLFGPAVNVTVPAAPYGVDVPNPYGLPALASVSVSTAAVIWPVIFGLNVIALVSLLDRFRRSTGLVRLQYRWLAWAVLVVGVATVAWVVLTSVVRVDMTVIPEVIVAVSYPAIPVAVVIAVLRYRLYDIDRLVSRTLGWGLATATVVAVFGGVVLALQAAFAGITQSGTLAVAASTLIAFALFQPVRRRLQAIVDGRFDRPRLEAEQILAGHGERLRHETDLGRIELGLIDTISETLRPSSAVLWIRGVAEDRS